jgi:hypothetical protein
MTFAQFLLFVAAAFNLQCAGALLQIRRQSPSYFARRARWYLPLMLLVNLCLVGATVWQWWLETDHWAQLHQQGIAPPTPPHFPAWMSLLIALYLMGASLYALSQLILTALAETVHRHQA